MVAPLLFLKGSCMRRFRVTLLAICLLLVYLGWNDADIYLRNQQPETITIANLEQHGAPREWLQVEGGYQDLQQAISTSGTVDLDALLVPLSSEPRSGTFQVLVETRQPRLLELFRTYHLRLDSTAEQRRFLAEHQEEFFGQRQVAGTVVTGLVASGNRDKLMKLARGVGMEIPEDVIFLSEGNEPVRYRGFAFLALGLIGLGRVLMLWRRVPASSDGLPVAGD
jgi:hypothetical protein